MITFALILALMLVASGGAIAFALRMDRLNAHVPMPVEAVEIAPVIWGPWASHEARCSCSVCR